MLNHKSLQKPNTSLITCPIQPAGGFIEISGQDALMQGLYTASGDLPVKKDNLSLL
jgi:hypothetical protein